MADTIRVSEQTMTVIVFRGREYVDVNDLLLALDTWANDFEEQGETVQAAGIRAARKGLSKPNAKDRVVGRIPVRT